MKHSGQVVRLYFSILGDLFGVSLDAGIVDGYDSFFYEVTVGAGYIETVLTVENKGVRVTDAETDYNGAILYRLVKELRECVVVN